jgi:hypothetical protein
VASALLAAGIIGGKQPEETPQPQMQRSEATG